MACMKYPQDTNSVPQVYMRACMCICMYEGVNVGMNIYISPLFWYNDMFGVLVFMYVMEMECVWLVFALQTESLVELWW